MWAEKDVKLSINTESSTLLVVTVPVNNVRGYAFEKYLFKVEKTSFHVSVFSGNSLIKDIKTMSNLNRNSVSNKYLANSKLTYIFSVCIIRDERQITTSFKDFKKYIFIFRK